MLRYYIHHVSLFLLKCLHKTTSWILNLLEKTFGTIMRKCCFMLFMSFCIKNLIFQWKLHLCFEFLEYRPKSFAVWRKDPLECSFWMFSLTLYVCPFFLKEISMEDLLNFLFTSWDCWLLIKMLRTGLEAWSYFQNSNQEPTKL